MTIPTTIALNVPKISGLSVLDFMCSESIYPPIQVYRLGFSVSSYLQPRMNVLM